MASRNAGSGELARMVSPTLMMTTIRTTLMMTILPVDGASSTYSAMTTVALGEAVPPVVAVLPADGNSTSKTHDKIY